MKRRWTSLFLAFLTSVSAGFLASTAGCSSVLGLGDFKNECDGPVDAPCDGSVLCQPGQQQSCYTGDPSTKDKGICKSGMKTCGSDGLFGDCEGEVLPKKKEICGNGLDDDCNGRTDDGCCVPGKKYVCYTPKDQSKMGVGDCKSGEAVCGSDGMSLGSCVGEVTPQQEDFDKKGDENCDGIPSADTLWVDPVTSADGLIFLSGVAASDDGSIYLSGAFSGTSMEIAGKTLTNSGTGEAFLAKLSSDGIVAWTAPAPIGLPGQLRIAPKSQNVVRFEDLQSSIEVDELDPTGNAVWSTSCTFTGMPDLQLGLLTVDGNDRAAIAGALYASLDCGGTMVTPLGMNDQAILHFAADHSLDWSRDYPNNVTRISGIEATHDGKIWMLAQINSYADFDTAIIGVGPNDDSIALVRYDASGNVIAAKAYGDDALPLGMAIDGQGNVFVAAYNNGTMNIGGDQLDASSGKNLVVAAFDSAGGALWGAQYKAPSGFVGDNPIQVAAEPDGRLAIGIGVRGTINFGAANFLTDEATYTALAVLTPQPPPAPPKLEWVKYYGGDKSDSNATVLPIGMALAPRQKGQARDLVLMGVFDKPADFGTGTIPDASANGSAFLMRVAP